MAVHNLGVAVAEPEEEQRGALGGREPKEGGKETARLLPTLDEFGGSQSFAGPVRQRRIAANGCAETELAAGLPFAIAPNVRPRPVPNRKHQPGDCMVVGLSVVVAQEFDAALLECIISRIRTPSITEGLGAQDICLRYQQPLEGSRPSLRCVSNWDGPDCHAAAMHAQRAILRRWRPGRGTGLRRGVRSCLEETAEQR